MKNNFVAQKHFIEEDILLVHKPVGISSFGLIRKMRKILSTKKIGHAGTLDPLASGLMILGINNGTKKMKNYVGLDKVYLAEIIIGRSTTTGDKEGEIVAEKIPHKHDMLDTNIDIALQSLVGEKYYPAPLYSAVKVLGKPLYKYARDGIKPPFIPEKLMDLKKVTVLDTYKSGDIYIVKVRAEVGSGTYIRTLAEEFGKRLAYPASLKSLYRLSIGKYLDINSFYIKNKKNNRKHAIIKMYSLMKRLFRKNKK